MNESYHILVEGKMGHGALPKRKDFRDFVYHRLSPVLGGAPTPFDWTTGFDLTTTLPSPLIVENQFQSFSCGGQALRYYLEALKSLNDKSFTRLSAHDPYCQIYYPGGGTTIHDIAKLAVQVGIRDEATVPSYLNGDCPEYFMESKAMSNSAPQAQKFAEFGFAFPNTDTETIASAIRDNNGCILQIEGHNNGTWLSKFPSPVPGGISWSHFVLAVGAVLVDGKKFIKIINSWGMSVGDGGYQYLGEDYFQGGISAALVFFDKSEYVYQPTVLQIVTPTWLQKFLSFFVNYFTN